MSADYEQVLKDLDDQVGRLEAEIATLKAGRPTIVVLRNRYAMEKPTLSFAPPVVGAYANMGPTDAIPHVLRGKAFAMSTQEVADALSAGGVKSNAQDFPRSVSATLGQLRDKGIVLKVGDGWRLKTAGEALQEIQDENERKITMKEIAAVTF